LQNEHRAAENVFPFSLHAHIVSYLLAIARLEAAGDLCGVPTVADISILLGVLIARVADETRQMAGAIEVVRTGQLIWRLNRMWRSAVASSSPLSMVTSLIA
jgi:hypothetical protein